MNGLVVLTPFVVLALVWLVVYIEDKEINK